jgi:hypothetical protein
MFEIRDIKRRISSPSFDSPVDFRMRIARMFPPRHAEE